MAVKKIIEAYTPYFFILVCGNFLMFYLMKEKKMANITLNQLYMDNFKYVFLGNGFNCDFIMA